MRKSLLFIVLLTFASVMFAKSYTVSIQAPTKVGSVQLAKGSYTLHVDGDKVLFTDDHQKTVSVPAKLNNSATKKFEFTSVEATEKNGQETIKLIHLGGSTTTVEFGD